MKLRLWIAVVGLAVIGSTAFAAGSLTGKWSGSFDIAGPNGETRPDSAYMVLKEQDGMVEGTAGPSSDKQWPIKNGTLAGTRLTFQVNADDGLLTFDLSFDGETIQGTAQGQRSDGEKMSARLNLKRE